MVSIVVDGLCLQSVRVESELIVKVFAQQNDKVFTNASAKSNNLKPTSNNNIDCNVIAKTIKN